MFQEALRRLLVKLCRNPVSRAVPRSKKFPCKWSPDQVYEPDSGWPFTNAGAWEFIADRLEEDHSFEVIAMDKPAGSHAIVMKIQAGQRKIYVKIQLYDGRVIGRSFHY